MRAAKTLDLTTGSVTKKLIRFAIPIMLGNLLQQMYTAADRIIVGRFAEDGTAALGAVGATTSAINLIIGLFIGLATGVNVICANLLGARNETALRKGMHTSMLVSLICGVFLCLLGYFLTPVILGWMDTPQSVADQAVLYMQIYFMGVPGALIYNFGAGILRAHGDTKRPMYFLMVSGLVNVALNMLLVIVFHMGVSGVAIATMVSQYLSAGAVLLLLFAPKGEYRLSFRELKLDKQQLSSIVRVGVPTGLGSVVFSISNVLLQSSTNSFNSEAIIAARTAATDINSLIYQIQAAFYAGCVSFSGQCYGAGNHKRIGQVATRALLICTLFMGVPIALCAIFAKEVVTLFNNDPAVLEAGVPLMLINTLGLIAYIPSEIFMGCSRGMRKALTPTAINMFVICVPRLIWIYTVFPRHRNITTLFICYPISWGLSSIAQFIYFYCVKKKMEKQTETKNQA